MSNDETERGYPLPHPDNIAVQDVERIRNAIMQISNDTDAVEHMISKIEEGLNTMKLEKILWSSNDDC